MAIQSELDKLRVEALDPDWDGALNQWVRLLGPSKTGEIGELLAQAVLGGRRMTNNRAGYDLVSGDKKIEVKLSSLIRQGGVPVFVWRQIRLTDPYTHLCFIAVYPGKARIFLVPKEVIPTSAMTKNHGRGDTVELYQIKTSKVDELFDWMTQCEIIP